MTETRRELAAQLDQIDRRFQFNPHRYAVRAAACWHAGDLQGVHDELCRALAQAADAAGLPRGEINRFTMPASMQLTITARDHPAN